MEGYDDRRYDPEGMKRAYDKLEHNNARAEAIRAAIKAADQQEDNPYRIFFRLDLCRESCFYGDRLDMMVIFPEVLAIADRYPDTPHTIFNNNFKDSMDHILWVYKWILSSCSGFYQIPMSDCRKFFADFKRRSQAYGYNLKPYYKLKSLFYQSIDREENERAFHLFEQLPRDGNCDCKACDRTGTIDFYLRKGDLQRADALSKDIENFTLRCGGGERMRSWVNMKAHYMHYYLRKQDFAKAQTYCEMIDPRRVKNDEFSYWDDFLYCYAHTNIGKALQIYKSNWKRWQEQRQPATIFGNSLNIACFFMELYRTRRRKTVKLALDASFPLFTEHGQYRIADLYRYYYDRAADMAHKLDTRNGTDYYRRLLQETVGEQPWEE